MTGQDTSEMVEYPRPTDPVASVYIGSPPVHDTGLTWNALGTPRRPTAL